MLREKYGLPPLTPEEQITRLIRDEVDAMPVQRHWDRSTTRLLVGVLTALGGLMYVLGLTPTDIGSTAMQLFHDVPDLTAVQSL